MRNKQMHDRIEAAYKNAGAQRFLELCHKMNLTESDFAEIVLVAMDQSDLPKYTMNEITKLFLALEGK